MATLGKVTIPLDSFDHKMTVTAHITRQFRVRMWIALKLFALGAWVLKANFNLEVS